MNIRGALYAATLALALSAMAQIDPAEQADEAEPPPSVSNVFVDADLREVLQDIATQAGVNIIPAASVGGYVSCELKEASVEQALRLVLSGTGFGYRRIDDFYLVYSTDPRSAEFASVVETTVVRLNYIEAEAAVRLLSPAFRPYVQAGKEPQVVITAPPVLAERIARDVALLDRPPRHVMLDARIVVLEEAQFLNIGVQWHFPTIRAGIFTDADLQEGFLNGPRWPWGLQIGYTRAREFTNSLLLALNLLGQNDQATIVANPQIMAQDMRPAEIRVTTDEYFQIVTPGIYATATLEKIESGTVMRITPRIGQDGQITLDMVIEVSDVVARGADNLPVVSRRTAQSTVRVESGGTAAVAGLVDRRTTAISTRVPGAASVPLAGHLFRNESARDTARQIAVFITATVEDDVVLRAQRPARPALPTVDVETFRQELREILSRQGPR